MLVAPGWEFSRRSEPGTLLALAVNAGALPDEIAARSPDLRGAVAVRSCAIALHANDVGAIESTTGDFASAAGADSNPRRRVFGEARSIALVSALLLRGKGIARAVPMAAARFAMPRAWIEAHLPEPLTIGDLCRIADVGERGLQLTFASLRGVSPMRYVAKRRLAAARRLLARSDPDADVKSVATAVRFSHLGRFAAMYRQAYGEPPSGTLKSWSRHVARALPRRFDRLSTTC